ncbi:MAG TPA: DUF2911 domain-containing protein [Gemmatimonadaceae bacterium]|nr:DUF2911 domain-containing protein [Gemmatimonadaceae bacterium]
MRNAVVRACALLALALPASLSAQARVFIMKLGSDTVGLERVVRTGNKAEGVIVRHIPANSMLKYSLVFAKDGHVESFEQGSYRADGTPNPPNPQTGTAAVGLKMTFVGDTVIREVQTNGQPVVRRTVVPKGTLPSIGGSWYAYELQVAAARKDGKAYTISFAGNANAPVTPDIRIITRDSAEIVNQGFRLGIATDKKGMLVHGDGSLTTQKLDVTPVKDVDVEAIGRAWAATAAAAPAAPTNTPDSVIATLGSAHVRILYSRPARRGRELWGKLVPFDTTWRLGADYATQLKTDADLDIGGTTVKAGTYTLWLLPSQGQSFLLVNTKILDPRDTTRRLWGTEWDPANDIAKIPVQKHMNLPVDEERFHIFIENGMLMMHWGNSGYGVSIKAK